MSWCCFQRWGTSISFYELRWLPCIFKFSVKTKSHCSCDLPVNMFTPHLRNSDEIVKATYLSLGRNIWQETKCGIEFQGFKFQKLGKNIKCFCKSQQLIMHCGSNNKNCRCYTYTLHHPFGLCKLIGLQITIRHIPLKNTVQWFVVQSLGYANVTTKCKTSSSLQKGNPVPISNLPKFLCPSL